MIFAIMQKKSFSIISLLRHCPTPQVAKAILHSDAITLSSPRIPIAATQRGMTLFIHGRQPIFHLKKKVPRRTPFYYLPKKLYKKRDF